ncbi:type II toxin-antitoxin system RelB/DinJ family antitoxin [Quisquiliibacterium transsilvanicum]|uniref:DNA-damage-inducible protein J n=1 Tax=Quisquiliibacterium transsilvanicum TaxID=1549638 RepID=A0A7W8M7Q3_9BURK|nr:type II toxin-antitoxin system RelB/DinJ family antitoxin [Quisquiliibacterium transsilvanicum]MBB5270194.1 DNA-damage-inducible protein J [Quisquiliibacterium transsilvanicum]
MAHSTMLHVRVDEEIKTQATEALAAMGLSVSDAVRILLIAKARAARFGSADALIDDLEKARQQ